MKSRSFRILGAALAALLPACGGGGNGSGGTSGGGTGNPESPVTLLEPSDGQTFTAPARIPLTAEVADPNASIAKVDFLQGSTVIKSAQRSFTGQFQNVWFDVPAGTYTISAVATDDQGAQTTSAPATITVLSSGWTTVAAVGQGLSGIWFVDASEGWVVGDGGTILHSVDGGVTWVPQSSGTSQNLSKIQFVDASRGWVVGDGGTLLFTTDGGSTWTPSSVGTEVRLIDLSFVDAQTGWVVAQAPFYNAPQDPNVYATMDGGVTWAALPTGAPGAVSNHTVRFADRSNGWIVTKISADFSGVGADVDAVLRTTDGGLTWTEQFRTQHTDDNLEALAVASATTAWVSRTQSMMHGNVGIWHTADGGATWTPETNGIDPANFDIVLPAGLAGIDALDFVSATQGWGVGRGFSGNAFFGTIIHTEDGGQSWTIQRNPPFPEGETLLDVHFVDVNTGWAVRSDGVILKTTSGGKGS